MTRLQTSQRGFTLLETLVAFVIAAGAFLALFQAVSTGLRAAAISDHTLEAWQRAASRLAAQSISLRPGDASGDDGGGFAWHSTIRQRQDAPMIGAPAQLRLYTVAITISWRLDGGDRHVELVSDRLAIMPALTQ